MIPETERRSIVDEEHVRLLSMVYFIMGGVTAAFAFFPLMYVAMGAMLASLPATGESQEAAVTMRAMAGFMIFIGLTISIIGWTIAAIRLYAGYCLAKRKHRVFCLVAAAISCFLVPYGTILGVLSFLVLLRPSVRERFLTGRGTNA